MLPINAVGPAPSVRSGGDAAPPPQFQNTSITSGAAGNDKPTGGAETNQAIDPATQLSADQPLPEEETREAARLSEPVRLSAESIARQSEVPTPETPAGPPPAFDFTVLEKARAISEIPQTENPNSDGAA